MPINANIFGDGANFEDRYITDYPTLARKIDACRGLGLSIVLTMGSFDMYHVGHVLYLQAAKKLGDVLVVGIDSDEKIQKKKGPHRPAVPEDERLQVLAESRSVDIVTLKRSTDPKWALIKCVSPDVLQSTEDTYTPKELELLREYCKEIVVQKRMAMTSTSARIRRLVHNGAEEISRRLATAIPQTIEDVFKSYKDGTKI